MNSNINGNGSGNHLYHTLRHFPNVRIGIQAANELQAVNTANPSKTKKNNYYHTAFRLGEDHHHHHHHHTNDDNAIHYMKKELKTLKKSSIQVDHY